MAQSWGHAESLLSASFAIPPLTNQTPDPPPDQLLTFLESEEDDFDLPQGQQVSPSAKGSIHTISSNNAMDGGVSTLDPVDAGTHIGNNGTPDFCQTLNATPAAMAFSELQALQVGATHPPVPPPPRSGSP